MINPDRHFALKKPCENCPFRCDGKAIDLAPGRLTGIIRDLLTDDGSTFQCHKTVHSDRGGEWSDDGDYVPSGDESMCAGAAAFLMKNGRPNIAMRLGFMSGIIKPDHWDKAKPLVIGGIARLQETGNADHRQ
jgi:hypothetical protein